MISYGQQKKEGTIQNEEFVTEKVRKIEVQPTMSRSSKHLMKYRIIARITK